MNASPTALAQIVAQASSLSELINTQSCKFDSAQTRDPHISNRRLAHWCQIVAEGDWAKFQKRLQWDRLDIESARQILGGQPCWVYSQALPNWAETLKEIIQAASGFIFEDESQNASTIKKQNCKFPLDPEDPLPFEDIMLPALSVAQRKVLTRLASPSLVPDYLPLELLSETGYLSLLRSLLQKLVKLCERCLEYEFSCFRPLGHNLLNLIIGESHSDKSKVYYTAFVQQLLGDGLLAFYQKYPVLGRLVATTIDFWVEATAEFLQRLKADIHQIQQLYQSSAKLGKVTEIRSSLSDAHNQGRSVIIFAFESGLKLVYKPRSVDLEAAYNQFLDWCNRQSKNTSFLLLKRNQENISLPFKVLKVLNCQGYGWIEYVEHLPCEDELAVQRFYQRAGMLLCLLYIIRGTDCHHENLIASGEYPVLVDVETLMHHQRRTMAHSLSRVESESSEHQLFKNSVLRTALLPYWDFDKDHSIIYDLSGLGSTTPQQIPRRSAKWRSVNTDDMYLEYETVIKSVQKNVPILNGAVLSPNDSFEELILGFQQMYHFMIRRRNDLLATDSPLAAFKGQKVRFIFRFTLDYGIVLLNSLAPDFLRNGVDRGIELETLGREFLISQDKPDDWSIFQAEIKAMEQLDFPYFEAYTDSDALMVGRDQPIKPYFIEPSYSQVLNGVQKLSETDLAWQVTIIRGTFYARVAESAESSSGEAVATRQPPASLLSLERVQTSPSDHEQLLVSAHDIALEIQSQAITEADGSVYWIGLSSIPNSKRFQFQPLDESLYNGNCGIALFLAALDYLTESNQFRDLALAALRYTRRALQIADSSLAERLAKAIGMGGAMGLGSIIYSLVKISHLLQEPTLIEDAHRVAHLITPELIAADQHLDVVCGAAGTILGLLALYNETAEQPVLNKAITCAQHLLEHRLSVNGSPRAWKTSEEKPLTGFSHGAAGIAHALVQLYAKTHNSDYLEAAYEGIAYERYTFSSSAANWPDFRSLAQRNGQTGFMVSWCHGAPGIALGRLGCLSTLETEEIHQEVEVALQTTQKYGMQGVDQLCCGNLGRCEVLLAAAQKLFRPELLKIAQQRAAWVVVRAKQTGTYQLFANLPPHVFNPGFFQGTAGIGYELLRLAYPEALPSVLLWE